MPVQVTHNVTLGFLWDVMTTAVESHYEWFGFEKVTRRPGGDDEHALCVTSFSAVEVDDDDGINLSITVITPEVMRDAIVKLLAGGLVHKGLTASIASAVANDDAGNIDADAADCILQVACFDEIRYG